MGRTAQIVSGGAVAVSALSAADAPLGFDVSSSIVDDTVSGDAGQGVAGAWLAGMGVLAFALAAGIWFPAVER